MKEKKYKVKI